MLKWLSNYICLYIDFEKMGHHEFFAQNHGPEKSEILPRMLINPSQNSRCYFAGEGTAAVQLFGSLPE
jgi:hypothetical protein